MTWYIEILKGFKAIGLSFVSDWSIWWVLAPILLVWFIIEAYFGAYKKEKLGWNTALANGVTLLWITVEGMRFTFSEEVNYFWMRFLITLLFLALAGFLIYISFTHKFSDKITFSITSPTVIYFLAMSVILFTHGSLEISGWVLLDMIILFFIIMGIFELLKHFIPRAKKDVFGELEQHHEYEPPMQEIRI